MNKYVEEIIWLRGIPAFFISRGDILAVAYVPLALSSRTQNLHKPSRTTVYVTLPLGFSTPRERCNARAATPLVCQ